MEKEEDSKSDAWRVKTSNMVDMWTSHFVALGKLQRRRGSGAIIRCSSCFDSYAA